MRPTHPLRAEKRKHFLPRLGAGLRRFRAYLHQSALPPSPVAGGLLVGGHVLLLLSLCHFIALFHSPHQVEALLYLEPYMDTFATSIVLLWLLVLGMDWLERRHRP